VTSEVDFRRAIDARPDDGHTLLVFADWLQERDDGRADGYRALARLGKYPQHFAGLSTRYPWSWWYRPHPGEEQHDLDAAWYRKLRGGKWKGTSRDYRSAFAALDAAARAFAKLPAERRAAFLAGPVEAARGVADSQ
jgi:uncharacterized protein (TIGR02996 family)